MEYAKTSRGIVQQHEGREEYYIECSAEMRYRACCHGQAQWKMRTEADPVVLVQFKNKRTDFYLNTPMLHLEVGDLVTVSTAPGHDVGAVTLTGWAAHREYMKSRHEESERPLELFRLSTRSDVDRWIEYLGKEHDALLITRQEAEKLRLEMKVFDVEYQGDGNKLTVYYSSERRVDFRLLVKQLADHFGIRIQMQQLGIRQEPARIGGLGLCGQEMCCARWMKRMPPVLSLAMKMQDLQVLSCTGQCGKLKCCLNFELDAYIEARNKMPKVRAPLQFDGYNLYYVKSDIFRELMWFSSAPKSTMNLVILTADEVREVMAINARGEVAKPLEHKDTEREVAEHSAARIENVIEADNITRFDKQRTKSKKSKRKRKDGAQAEGDQSVGGAVGGLSVGLAEGKGRRGAKDSRASAPQAAGAPTEGPEGSNNAKGRIAQGARGRGKRNMPRNATGPRAERDASASPRRNSQTDTAPDASAASDRLPRSAGAATQPQTDGRLPRRKRRMRDDGADAASPEQAKQ